MPGQLTVRPVDIAAEGHWAWDTARPTWRPATYSAGSEYDPFPAYPHDIATAEQAAARTAEIVPPLWDVTVWIASLEPLARTNGHSNVWVGEHYDDDAQGWVKDEPQGMILLAAKRAPPHPAMTRYLVAHEYGHNVEWMLCRARGAKHIHDDTDLIAEYTALRGGGTHHGDGGRWHDSAHELLACDFRILVLGVETEFWPHPGIPRPEKVKGLAKWWGNAIQLLASYRRER